MQPPQGIDMNLIKEAIARRAAGGGGTPVTQQVSIPGGQMPDGSSTSPLQAPPQQQPTGALLAGGAPQPAPTDPGAPQYAPQPQYAAPAADQSSILSQLQQAGGQSPTAGAPSAAGGGGGAGFDDHTKNISKALIARLLKVL